MAADPKPDFDKNESPPNTLAAALLVIERQQQRIAKLDAEVCELLKQLKQRGSGGSGGGEGGGRSSAHPFGKGPRKPKAHHKRPGRQSNDGLPHEFRREPSAEWPSVEETVPAPAACPHCAGAVEPLNAEVVTLTDLPQPPKPVVQRFRLGRCRCLSCDRISRATHPKVPSTQTGATAHRLGSAILATAQTIRHAVGVPVNKLPSVLEITTGVKVSPSALTQHALKQADPGQPVAQAVEQLEHDLRNSARCHLDTTGYKTGSRSTPLAVYSADSLLGLATVLYTVEDSHTALSVQQRLHPPNQPDQPYPGTMISDRHPVYDANLLKPTPQQKCLDHVSDSITEVQAKQHPGARSFGNELLGCLHQARELWREFKAPGSSLSWPAYEALGRPILKRMDGLLRPRLMCDEGNARLLRELGKQHERGHLLRFLDDPEIEPTNNRAERDLRYIVIGRKTSQCSKTDRGAASYVAFCSVLQTVRRRVKSGVNGVLAGVAALIRLFNRDSPAAALIPAR